MKTLRPYQKKALQDIYSSRYFGLFLQMRLGKTLITIRRLRREEGPFLVVAPYDALISWRKELQEERESFILLTGTGEERRNALQNGLDGNLYRYYLTNKESHLILPQLTDVSWNAVILDESTFIKSPKAKVTKFFLRNFRAAPVRICLTGLPDPESRLDYVCQFLFLNPSWIRSRDYWSFRSKYAKPIGYDWFLNQDGRQLIADALSHCVTLSRKDVKMDREKIYTVRSVVLPDKLRKVYDEISNNFMLEYENTTRDTTLAIVAYNWMRELSNGFIDGNLVFQGKYNVLMSLLSGELKGEQVVIWTNHIPENDFVTSLLGPLCRSITGKTHKLLRLQFVEDFQTGRVPYIVCQVECAKYSLDFSCASTAIYVSCPPGNESRQQSEDRILSVTGKGPLLYTDIVMENTVDQEIYEGVREKKSAQSIQSAILRRLNASRSKTN